MSEKLTRKDIITGWAMIASFLFLGVTMTMACQSDRKVQRQANECETKGGIWLTQERVCMAVHRIPVSGE